MDDGGRLNATALHPVAPGQAVPRQQNKSRDRSRSISDRLEDSVRVFEIAPSLPMPITRVQRWRQGPADSEGARVDSEAQDEARASGVFRRVTL